MPPIRHREESAHIDDSPHVLQTSGEGLEGDRLCIFIGSDITSRMRRSALSDHRRVDAHGRDQATDRQGSGSRVWDCGSPLYDSYELAAVNQLLERHMMVLPPSCGSTQQMITVMPSGKGGPSNGRGGTGEAGPFFSTTALLAKSLGRRLWQRLKSKGNKEQWGRQRRQ